MVSLRIRDLHRVVSRGKVYYYHRPTKTRLHAPFGTAAFLEELERLKAAGRMMAQPKGLTLRQLVDDHYHKAENPDWINLQPATKKSYEERVFDLLDDPLQIGGLQVRDIVRQGQPFGMKVRDAVFALHGRWQANYVLTVLAGVFKWAKPYGLVKGDNPFAELPRVPRAKDAPIANRRWTYAEYVAVQDELGRRRLQGVRCAVALGLMARFSRADMIAFAWSGYNGAEIDAARHKTGVSLWKPAAAQLREILDAMPRSFEPGRRRARAGRMVRIAEGPVCRQDGERYTAEGLSATFHRTVKHLEGKGLVGKGLTLHGLGHTVASWLAEDGASKSHIQAFLGHASTAATDIYVQQASQKTMAGAAVVRLDRVLQDKTRSAAGGDAEG